MGSRRYSEVLAASSEAEVHPAAITSTGKDGKAASTAEKIKQREPWKTGLDLIYLLEKQIKQGRTFGLW